MDRPQAMAVGMVVVAVLVGITLGRAGVPVPADAASLRPVGDVTEPRDVESAVLIVYVSGSVANPGVVRLPEGAIVADAIAAAGGAMPQAQLEAINLAQPVVDGEQVHVPSPGDDPAPRSGAPGDGKIAVNRATASELEALPGVGPVLAERIVAYREANGPFQTVEDLLDVPGVGEAKLAAMRDVISVP